MKWQGIMIHHSGGADTARCEAAAYRHHHQKVRGWLDIGYHAVCEKIGKEYQIIGGRPFHVAGAHCPGKNRTHLGLCLAGNFELGPPPEEQLEVAARWCAGWCGVLGIPAEAITIHCRHRETLCPGAHFELEGFRARVEALRRKPYPIAG